MLYKEFEYYCSSVCGCTNNIISYFIRKNLIPKYEAENTEEKNVTLDQQITQMDTIVKASNVNDVNL